MSEAHSPALSVPHISARDRHPEKLSELLQRIAASGEGRVTIREVALALEDRSFGAFLFVFALPNIMPLPPGATIILGLPMIFVALQMVAGYEKVWLPKALADYSMERETFARMVAKVNPWLKRAEKWIKPRGWPLGHAIAERLFGLYVLLLAIICVAPIPFGNWPPAFAVAILGMAHTERDGRLLAIGAVSGLIAILVAGLVLATAGALLMHFF